MRMQEIIAFLSLIDGDCHRKLSEAAIEDARQHYRPTRMVGLEDVMGQVLRSVNDMVDVRNPSMDRIGQDCSRVRFRLDKLMDDIWRHERDTTTSPGNA